MGLVRCILLMLSLAACAGAADGGLDAAALDRLKAATVFVISLHGGSGATGSGFVVRFQGNSAFIVTNDHVARPDHLPADIKVILNSGGQNEREYPAKLVGDDPVLDLAILQIDGDGLPSALPVSKASPHETQPAYVFGYPFGEDLSSSSRHPSVTVGRASVSSLRMDDYGQLNTIQLDGALNPGNSGGPVVDLDGNVLGVAVAAVLGTQIGFVIPAQKILAELDGRACFLQHVALGDPVEGKVNLRVLCSDPFHKITAVSLLVIAARKVDELPKLDAHGEVQRMPGDARQVTLSPAGDEWSGTLSLHGLNAGGGDYLVQVATTSGKVSYSQAVHVDFSSDTAMEQQPGMRPGPVPSRPNPRPPRRPSVAPRAPSSPEQSAAACLPTADPGWRELGLPTPGEEVSTPLDGLAGDVAVGGGGRYVVAAMPDKHAIAIYDADKKAISHTLKLPSDHFEIAAGGDTLLVFLDEAGILSNYNLATGEKRKSKLLPIAGTFVTMAMGRSLGDRVLIRMSKGSTELDWCSEHMLDTRTFEELPIDTATGGCNGLNTYHISFRDFVHQRPDGMMNCIGEWCTSGSPNGLGNMLFGADQMAYCYSHETHGWVDPGDDDRIYCGDGSIYDRLLKSKGTIPGQALIPACGGILVLGIGNDGRMTLFPSGSTTPVLKLGTFQGYATSEINDLSSRGKRLSPWSNSRFQFDKQVILDAIAGRLITIPMSLDAITERPLNVKSLLEDSGVDYLLPTTAPALLARSGKLYKGQLNALSKVPAKFSLESGPDGMTVSPTGLVQWTPGSEMQGPQPVVVSIEAADNSCLQTFTVYVN